MDVLLALGCEAYLSVEVWMEKGKGGGCIPLFEFLSVRVVLDSADHEVC